MQVAPQACETKMHHSKDIPKVNITKELWLAVTIAIPKGKRAKRSKRFTFGVRNDIIILSTRSARNGRISKSSPHEKEYLFCLRKMLTLKWNLLWSGYVQLHLSR